MNFAQLEYVLAVHQHKHFSNAAYSCDITQATLSAMIKKLENELGYLIFERSSQPIQTTSEGLAFIEIATQILGLKKKALEIDIQPLSSLEGKLRVGIIPTIANSLLPIILPELIESNPKLMLEIVEITTEEIKNQLLTNDIDLAIAATPLENDLFEEEVMYYEPMMVYGSSYENKKYVSSEEIREGKIWLLEEGHCFRNQVMTLCEIKEKPQVGEQLTFQGNSFDTLINLSEQLGGYTLVPELFFQSMPDSRQKKTKHFQKPIPVREISLVTYRLHTPKPTIYYLQEFIKSRIAHRLSSQHFKNSELDIIGI